MSLKHSHLRRAFGAVTPAFAQQSAFFKNREEYRTSLAEKLYQNKIYKASQYEFARQYFYQNPEGAKKEASLFYDNIIGVILNQNHSEEGLEAFTKSIRRVLILHWRMVL